MASIESQSPYPSPQLAADRAVALARTWVAAASSDIADAAARRLAAVLHDPGGLEFTVGFVDRVVRPQDRGVAAHNLRKLARKTPHFLQGPLRAAIKVGGLVGPAAPNFVVPTATATLRGLVSHLILDLTPEHLGPAISSLRERGVDLNINLLGEAVLGKREAGRRLLGTMDLLRRADVDYVSVKVSSVVAPHSRWAFDQTVTDICNELRPLFKIAASYSPHKFINLDMEEFRDLELTLAVFMHLLDDPQFASLSAGVALQAYLPDSYPAMIRLQEWAANRVARGGAPIKVRLVKGANLPMERAEAELRGWPLATWPTKVDTDTSYKALLDYALTPAHTANVRVGIAGHNIFDIALAHTLVTERGVGTRVEFEMILGMAPGLAQAISADVGRLLLYTPVVAPKEFDVAISYLVRRLEEGAAPENFLSAAYGLDRDPALFEREEHRFRQALRGLDQWPRAGTFRTQDRAAEELGPQVEFANTADTEPDLPANFDWAQAIFAAIPASTAGEAGARAALITEPERLDEVIAQTRSAARGWQELGAAARAGILRKAAVILGQRRALLLEVMGAECAKTLDQGDVEVSEAVDYANYYAAQGLELERVAGATWVPSDLTIVTPPWNFPLAILAGSVLAALGSGSAVILKPAHQAKRCGAVLAQALWDAGVPREVLALVQLSEQSLGRQLIASPLADRVILTGAYETARLFKRLRPDIFLLGETSGKNAIIVTPNADLDLAARDIAASAFGHAGQKCSAASLVILVGSVAKSARFRNQLLDSVASMRVGLPQDPLTVMGPLIEAPGEKLLRGLTRLESGEHWVLEPRPLNAERTLWSPGIRGGVITGSDFHQTEFFGPVLGIMSADRLDKAIDLANGTAFGLTSGLYSLDPVEMEHWLERIEAGNLYINRSITGAIVRRQPFGGWKRSAIGPGAKTGGPNYLFALGTWHDHPEPLPAAGAAAPEDFLGSLDRRVQGLYIAGRTSLSKDHLRWLAGALRSDQVAARDEFTRNRDVSGLAAEKNVLRYLPVPVHIKLVWPLKESGHGRLAPTAELIEAAEAQLLREVAAGVLAGSRLTVSLPDTSLGSQIVIELASLGIGVAYAGDPRDPAEYDGHLHGAPLHDARVRVIVPSLPGQGERALVAARRHELREHGVDVAVYAGPVVTSGRVTGLTYRHEQSVSVTAHRFGTPVKTPASLDRNP